MYTNADQLLNKRDDLLCTIAHDIPDVLFVTECIPKAQSLPLDLASLALPNFNLFLNFDAAEVGLGAQGMRGICVYVINTIIASEKSFISQSSVENLWIRIKLSGSDLLLAGCIYRSPSSDPKQSIEELSLLFQSALGSGASHVFVCGDFNIPHIEWADNFCTAPSSHYSNQFLDIVQDSMLFQHVTQPTRFREGQNPSILDLLFTNEEGMLSELCYLPGLGKSDHVVLWFLINCYTSCTVSHPVKLNFHKGNFVRLNSMLSVTEWECLASLEVDEFRVVTISISLVRLYKSRKRRTGSGISTGILWIPWTWPGIRFAGTH